MLFSSISFLYYFLPLVIISYFLVPNKYKNFILFLFSMFFYFYGEPKYLWLLLLSCFINYIFSLLIYNSKNQKLNKLYLVIAIILNLSLLIYYKYTNFFVSNLNSLFSLNINFINVYMPIGISFFTFQAMSYTIDVYRKDTEANTNFINFCTYVALFPQLVAGPIVRYTTINNELKERKHSYDLFGSGVKIFIIGLAKKVLLANVIGELCSTLSYTITETVLSKWIEAISFTLQIYFDFSGYSDMAIGLGLIFGFKFLENFNYPYISTSITEFWRRWHISLSSWLRDYVYIPLGGNRVSKLKWIRNIMIVWFLTGFWHGASYNFIIWGLYFAVLLIIEKFILNKFLNNHKIFGLFYTLFFVIISFVIFNGDNIQTPLNNLKSMFGFNNLPLYNKEIIYYLKSYKNIIVLAIISATPYPKIILSKLKSKNIFKIIISFIEPIYLIVLLTLVTSFLIDASYNPFLYFRF